jgi:hypothetical protein
MMDLRRGCALCLLLVITFGACDKRSVDDLTLKKPYANVIGTEYRIVGEVDAYGIYEDLNHKTVSYITLISGVGIAGPEVAFKRRIAEGRNFEILSAWRENKLLGSDIYYLVSIPNSELPQGIQIRLELSRGNGMENGEINPRLYEKLDSAQ